MTTRAVRERFGGWIIPSLVVSTIASTVSAAPRAVEVSGELKKWHRVTLTFTGPETRETATPNPFRDYRLNVTFVRGSRRLVVPGFYAADGDAAETSARSGNKWRAHFTPDETGDWTYVVSFRQGRDIALSEDPNAGSATAFDGLRGSLATGATDKVGRDHRAKGALRYVGKHHLRFAETGEYYLKGGADSPGNFLAYFEFDGTFDTDPRFNEGRSDAGKFVHHYAPHRADWRPGDPTWQNGKGRNIVGALNYLAGKGMNSVYFMTYNIDGGDGKDVWMWTDPATRDRYDCSKLDQWEIVFTHMDRVGIQLHVVTQETENDRKLGGSEGVNPVRKLYLRELCARFAHHPALIWNQGEENNVSDVARKAIARYVRAHDVYRHPITVHTHNNKAMQFYDGLLGDAHFEAASIQGDMKNYNRDAIQLRERSRQTGRPWAIYGDEQPSANVGVLPDAEDPAHDIPRIQALWGNLIGGGAGCEWYFGYEHAHMDLNCEDWRSRDRMWDQTRHALTFFQRHVPFWEMAPDNGLASGANEARVLARPGEVYAVQLPRGGTTTLDLGSTSATYQVRWYDPRAGGDLQMGTVGSVTGPGRQTLGMPPSQRDKDWISLVRRPANDR